LNQVAKELAGLLKQRLDPVLHKILQTRHYPEIENMKAKVEEALEELPKKIANASGNETHAVMMANEICMLWNPDHHPFTNYFPALVLAARQTHAIARLQANGRIQRDIMHCLPKGDGITMRLLHRVDEWLSMLTAPHHRPHNVDHEANMKTAEKGLLDFINLPIFTQGKIHDTVVFSEAPTRESIYIYELMAEFERKIQYFPPVCCCCCCCCCSPPARALIAWIDGYKADPFLRSFAITGNDAPGNALSR